MADSDVRVAIALGSNLADRHAILRSATQAIARLDGVVVIAQSRFEETEPVGLLQQPSFLNSMLLVATSLTLPALLAALQRVEMEHGRERHVPKGPRTLDLDIVWAEQVTITSDDLLVPHPGLLDREFWQRELAELLGVNEAAAAITMAQVHAGRDTARHAGLA